MGSLLSRFRKKLTTQEQLKKIEDSLKKIEDYKRNTERKQKRTVANVIIYGAALYILACVIVFVWYLPESWLIRLGLLIPLVMVPVIIYWMKRLISKYFQSKMVKANEDYADLQRKKIDIIDSVMETETFNKAKEILLKYAPEKLEKKLQENPFSPVPISVKTSPPDLRKRNMTNTNMSMATVKPIESPLKTTVNPISNQLVRTSNHNIIPSLQPPRMPLPQPLFPKERSFSDKLVEYIVGDGANYRYALICKYCRGHNGMALKEEFPYMSYTCCYCMTFNPARNQRPSAPRLPESPKSSAPRLPESPKPSALPAPDTKLPGPVLSPVEPKTEEKLLKESLQRRKVDAKTSKLNAKTTNTTFNSDDLSSKPIDEFIKQQLEEFQECTENAEAVPATNEEGTLIPNEISSPEEENLQANESENFGVQHEDKSDNKILLQIQLQNEEQVDTVKSA